MPAQGQATTYGELNVHTQPARQSPSFVQVKEKERMDVLTHVATPRADAAAQTAHRARAEEGQGRP